VAKIIEAKLTDYHYGLKKIYKIIVEYHS